MKNKNELGKLIFNSSSYYFNKMLIALIILGFGVILFVYGLFLKSRISGLGALIITFSSFAMIIISLKIDNIRIKIYQNGIKIIPIKSYRKGRSLSQGVILYNKIDYIRPYLLEDLENEEDNISSDNGNEMILIGFDIKGYGFQNVIIKGTILFKNYPFNKTPELITILKNQIGEKWTKIYQINNAIVFGDDEDDLIQ